MKKLYTVLFCLFTLPVFAQIGPSPISSINTWRVEQSYSIGQVVLRNGVVYQSLVNNNVAFDPAGSSGDWTTILGSSSGSQVYPGAGVANSTGAAWGTSYSVAGAGAALTTGPATSASGDVADFSGTSGQIADSGTAINSLAPLVSPAFSGTPTVGNTSLNTVGISSPSQGINIKQGPYYASGFAAVTTTSAAVTVGSTTISVANSASFSPGQVVVIALAGTTSGSTINNYCQLITSVATGSITLSTTPALTGALLPANCTSSTTGTQTAITATSGYNVYSLGSTTSASSAASGATSISLTNATSYTAGEGILISTGGASGVNLVTTISSISGNTITIPGSGILNASGIAAGVNIQHDDTTAFQTAIYQAGANSGAIVSGYTFNSLSSTIIVPDGVYQINGPLQNTSTANAILLMPNALYFTGNVWYPMATVQIKGISPPPQTQNYLSTTSQVSWNGAVIYTIGTSGAVFGGYDSSSLYDDMPNVTFRLEDVTLRAPGNPAITMINAQHIAKVQALHVSFDTTSTNYYNPSSVLTNAGEAFVMPSTSNAANSYLIDGEIVGWPTGVTLGEHAEVTDTRFDADLTPVIGSSEPVAYSYGALMTNDTFNGCYHGIYINSSTNQPYINVRRLNVEHVAAVSEDFYDPNNYFRGTVASDTPLIINGGTNVKFYNSNTYQSLFTGSSWAAQDALPGFNGVAGDEQTNVVAPYPNMDAIVWDKNTHAILYTQNGTVPAPLVPVQGLVAASAPAYSPVAGTYGSTQTVTASCSTGTVACSVGGSGTLLGGCSSISVSSSETLNAMCGGYGYTSTQNQASYIIGSVPSLVTSATPVHNGGAGTTVSTTITNTGGSGHVNVVGLMFCGPSGCGGSTYSGTITVSDGTNTYTYPSCKATSGGIYGYGAIAQNVVSGTRTVTATFSSTVDYAVIFVNEFANVNSTSALDQCGVNAATQAYYSGAGFNPTAFATTTGNLAAGNELVYGVGYISGGQISTGSGFTTISSPDTTQRDEYAIFPNSGATATATFGMTLSGSVIQFGGAYVMTLLP